MRTAATVTVSDCSARGGGADISNPATVDLLRQSGFEVMHHEVVPDDQAAIESALIVLSR